jgi:hypothetical protein
LPASYSRSLSFFFQGSPFPEVLLFSAPGQIAKYDARTCHFTSQLQFLALLHLTAGAVLNAHFFP